MAVWIIVGVCVVLGLAFVWWRDHRHHGRVDHSRVRDGITKYWTDEVSMSRRDRTRD